MSEILIEESLLGWKEFEMEVMRDRMDNCVVICSIENFDPMGVHTGDSITVAPAQTLTDKEYQILRNASLAVLREIGVDTGGSNVQFAINPDDGRMVVIEMNPRVSRSSALASKATGFPIAKVAAKLAIGYTLDELRNDITGGAAPASFEPSIDYVVTKIPRFAFEKFPGAEPLLTTAMKSVGEGNGVGDGVGGGAAASVEVEHCCRRKARRRAGLGARRPVLGSVDWGVAVAVPRVRVGAGGEERDGDFKAPVVGNGVQGGRAVAVGAGDGVGVRSEGESDLGDEPAAPGAV